MTRPLSPVRTQSISAVIEYAKWHSDLPLDVVTKAEHELELMDKTIRNTQNSNEKYRIRINRMYLENEREK